MSVVVAPSLAQVAQKWERHTWRLHRANKSRLPIDCRQSLRSKWVAQELLYWCTYHEPRHTYYLVLRSQLASIDVTARSEYSAERVVRLLYYWHDIEQHLEDREARRLVTNTVLCEQGREGARLRAALAFIREGSTCDAVVR